MDPTPGRIVHYKLTSIDVMRISSRRNSNQGAHGNGVDAGDIYPLLVVRILAAPGDLDGHKYIPSRATHGINGQVFLDGNDSFWVTSVHEGTELGQWSWPPRS